MLALCLFFRLIKGQIYKVSIALDNFRIPFSRRVVNISSITRDNCCERRTASRSNFSSENHGKVKNYVNRRTYSTLPTFLKMKLEISLQWFWMIWFFPYASGNWNFFFRNYKLFLGMGSSVPIDTIMSFENVYGFRFLSPQKDYTYLNTSRYRRMNSHLCLKILSFIRWKTFTAS